MIKILAILAILAVTALVLPAATDGNGSKPEHRRGEARQRVLEKFDADKDGKLSESERAAAKAACKARFEEKKQQFDTDGDGKLNDTERDAARAACSAKLKEKHPELFAKIDTDGNGEISREEGKAAREQRHEHRQDRREHRQDAGK